MKKQLIISLLALGLLSMPQSFAQQVAPVPPSEANAQIELNKLKYDPDFIMVGNIGVSVSDKIKLAPDTADFSIKYITEGTTPNDASNRNANNMKELDTYLKTLGITKEDLTTIAYRNYEKKEQKPVANTDKLHETILTINVVIPDDKFYAVVELLEKQGISSLEKNDYSKDFYYFTITEKATDAATTKQLAQKKYQVIEEQLKAQGISKVSVEKYLNQAAGEQTKEVKVYYVQNVIQVRVKNFDNLGKIIEKAQELKMSVNNDLRYSVSETVKNKVLEQAEGLLFEKLAKQAQRLLGSNDYSIGAPQSIYYTVNDSSIHIQPRNYQMAEDLVNAGQAQMYKAAPVEIQTPSEFEIIINLSGNFDILKKVYKTN